MNFLEGDKLNNKENYTIRNEQSKDQWNVEDLTRKAFWNLNVPGCNEHYHVYQGKAGR